MAGFIRAVRQYGPRIQPQLSLTQKALCGRLALPDYKAPWDAEFPDDPLELPWLMVVQAA